MPVCEKWKPERMKVVESPAAGNHVCNERREKGKAFVIGVVERICGRCPRFADAGEFALPPGCSQRQHVEVAQTQSVTELGNEISKVEVA